MALAPLPLAIIPRHAGAVRQQRDVKGQHGGGDNRVSVLVA